jgi:CubicO group peptidase (beta-lactamase class C family)
MRRLERVLAEAVDQGSFPSCTYRVLHGGTVAGEGVFGNAPAGLNTLYDLASVTKPLVMLGIMKLFEDGRLKLDDTASHFLPQMRRPDKEAITLRQLLTHSSGIPGQQPLYQRCATRAALLEAVYDLPLRNPPGTFVEYTSQGMMILGEIIEAITDMPMNRFLQRTFWEPLGLADLLFNPSPESAWRCAPTEDCPWRGGIVQGQVHDENAVVLGGIHAHAGLFGTAEAVSVVGQLLLNGGVYGGRRYLQPATVAVMTANHTRGLNLGRGLAWQCIDATGSPAGDLFSSDSFGHTGFTGTSIFVDPRRQIVFVLLTNRVHPSRENMGMVRVRPIAHNMVVLDLDGE